MAELKAVIREKGFNVHYPVEVRFVKGDDIWCSPAYGRDTAYIGIIMFKPYGFSVPFRQYFDEFEKVMARLGGRPHWAKDFRFTAGDMQAAYPMWGDFQKLTHLLDPKGTFSNEWSDRVIRGKDANGSEVAPWLPACDLKRLADETEQFDGSLAAQGKPDSFHTSAHGCSVYRS
jgi:hypothetical protein